MTRKRASLAGGNSTPSASKPLKETPHLPPISIVHNLPSTSVRSFWNHHYSRIIMKYQQQQKLATFEKYLPTRGAIILLKEYITMLQQNIPTKKSDRKRRAAPRCLYAGCGLSTLGTEIAKMDSALHVEQIDLSLVVVQYYNNVVMAGSTDGSEYMEKDRSTSTPHTRQMDVCQMSYDDQHFEYVVEKALLDCIIASNGEARALDALNEIFRVLKPHGYYICFSNSSRRLHLMDQKSMFPWDLVTKRKIDAFKDGSHFVWMYVFRKWSESRLEKVSEAQAREEASDVQLLADELMQQSFV